MKVLLWTQYFWPENFRINDLVSALEMEGVEVTVLTGKPNYPSGVLFPNYSVSGIQHEHFSKADVFRVPLLPRGQGSSVRLFLNYFSFILSGYFFAPFALRGRRFDVVFVYAPSPLLQALPAIFVSWIKRAPMVIWVQDIWPEALQATGFVKNRWILKLVELLVRYAYFHADSILIQSEAFRPAVERLVDDNAKIRYYPNSADDFPAANSTCESPFILQMKSYFSVVFTGNIGSAQSCETILSAAEQLQNSPGIRFYLVGGGSSQLAIAQEIDRKGLVNVVMTGQLPASDMPSIYSAASALLATLKDDSSLSATIPSKLQAYLAAGKPIIASLNGEGARLVIEAEAGIACPAEDSNGLAEAVLQIYDMAIEERNRLGRNGRQYFKTHFDLAMRTRELIRHLANISGIPHQNFSNE